MALGLTVESSSPHSSPKMTTVAFPPLHVRSSNAFPQSDDSADDERRNATALTIVELLARDSPNLPSLRPHSSVLPSLPKVLPSIRGERFGGFPSSTGGYNQSLLCPPPSPPKRRNAATGAVNNSRKRQKDELTRLRAQVQELQRELDHVRSRLPRKLKPEGRSPVAVNSAPLMGLEDGGDGSSVPVWERMAQHQKEEKSKAEMENLRLKGLIQEQLKISKGLEKLLRKRCKFSMSSSDDDACAALLGVKRPRASDTEETAVFASLASGLEDRLGEMEAVFEKGGLTRKKHELQETQMILDERRGPVMEVKDAKILPFDVKSCSSAMWATMETESQASVVGGTTSDTLCFKSSLPLRQHRAPDAEITVRCVIRRVVDDSTGRVAFVWESVAECPNRLPHVCSSAKGVEIRDCGWGLLEPLGNDSSSILQLCSYLMPQLCGVSSEQSRQHIHGLAEMVAPCYRGLWSKRQRSVENALMNTSIGSRSTKVEVKQEAAR